MALQGPACTVRQPQWSSLHALLPSVVLEPLGASLPSSVLNIMLDIREQAKNQVPRVLDIDKCIRGGWKCQSCRMTIAYSHFYLIKVRVYLRQNNSEAPLHGRPQVHRSNKSSGGFAEHRCDGRHTAVRHTLKMQREEGHKFKASLAPINKI